MEKVKELSIERSGIGDQSIVALEPHFAHLECVLVHHTIRVDTILVLLESCPMLTHISQAKVRVSDIMRSKP